MMEAVLLYLSVGLSVLEKIDEVARGLLGPADGVAGSLQGLALSMLRAAAVESVESTTEHCVQNINANIDDPIREVMTSRTPVP